ncbi:MAG: glycosyltransferase family 4 protein, partial [Flavobacteriales bacterium]|nr:glycosyltransferase family 4 protein [Flavobacteriales bacterium]
MRVAFISRSSLFDDPGGDTIQMQQTAAELSSFGVEVDIIENGKTYKQSDFDLLHFFNLIRPGEIMPHLPSKVPYVISPIYVDYSMSDIYARDGFNAKIAQNLDKNRVEYLKALMRFLKGSDKQISKKYFLIGHKNSMLKVLREANHLLPNSKSEEQRISTDLNQKVPTTIIPNGSTSIFSMDRKTPRKPGSILCVARIEPRKNQKNLILAVNDLPNLKLTLIGRPGNNSQDYYDECKRISGTNVEFIEGGLDQSELIDYYRSSSVHVLPSWFETTGLSSLEAGA